MLVKDFMAMLSKDFPNTYDSLQVSQLATLASLAAEFLKRTGDAYGPSPTEAPIEFLSRCLDHDQTPKSWARIWHLIYEDIPACLHDSSLFFTQGIPPEIHAPDAIIIPEHTFHPPTDHCLTCQVPGHQQPLPLEMRRQIYGYLLDINGIDSVQYFSGYCRNCNTTYTPCYIRRETTREHYSVDEGLPQQYFQVSQHYFMTHKLADYFNHLQMLAQVSVYNLVNSYNHTHAAPNVTYPNNFRSDSFTRWMSHKVCSLGLDIHRLLRWYSSRGLRLKSDHDKADNRRYFSAMEQSTKWMDIEGSPYFGHVCSLCTEVEEDPFTVKLSEQD
ncbi:hypothetical protein DFH28DRAFT_1225949 [Melampsora americana]|nr:hypothetical protein DFH28DRAFT_1225949 [Melampsora americana]